MSHGGSLKGSLKKKKEEELTRRRFNVDRSSLESSASIAL